MYSVYGFLFCGKPYIITLNKQFMSNLPEKFHEGVGRLLDHISQESPSCLIALGNSANKLTQELAIEAKIKGHHLPPVHNFPPSIGVSDYYDDIEGVLATVHADIPIVVEDSAPTGVKVEKLRKRFGDRIKISVVVSGQKIDGVYVVFDDDYDLAKHLDRERSTPNDLRNRTQR